MTLIKDKFLLHIINEMVSVVGPLRDLLHIYKFLSYFICEFLFELCI